MNVIFIKCSTILMATVLSIQKRKSPFISLAFHHFISAIGFINTFTLFHITIKSIVVDILKVFFSISLFVPFSLKKYDFRGIYTLEKIRKKWKKIRLLSMKSVFFWMTYPIYQWKWNVYKYKSIAKSILWPIAILQETPIKLYV